MNKQEFINSIKGEAIKGQSEYGILASITIAQTILESGWGSSKLLEEANNLFGIKAFSSWQGKRVTMPTTEWNNNQRQVVDADFRAYDNFNESIKDHSILLSGSRYNRVRESTDYKMACQSLYDCGYATDPQYPEKLIRIIEDNNLYELDSRGCLDEASITTADEKILKFQKLCNRLGIRDSEGKILAEDNILGWRTKSYIENMPVLSIGSIGPAVEYIQEIVGALPVDGEFGPITQAAVMEYQSNMGIDADGIVGIQTWSTIING